MTGRGMTLANRITLIRFLLVPFLVGSLVYYEPQKDYLRILAIVLFILAVATDGLDGYIARTRSQRSSLGVILDPLADKLLLTSAFIVLATLDSLPERFRIPPWVTIVVISRDLFILSGSAVIYLITQNLKVHPSGLGKITTFFQMVTVLVVLFGSSLRSITCVATSILTILSGLGYLRSGTQLLNASSSS